VTRVRFGASLLIVCAAAAAQTDAHFDRVQAAAKLYFRDIRELPMDVTVTTVVTDATLASGKGGELVFDHFQLESAGLPATGPYRAPCR
jgi:hypothetical protein